MTARRLPRPAALVLLATLLATLILPFFGTTPASARQPAASGVDDFSFSSWHTEIDATIEKGALGGDIVRSKFTETITAEFPDLDQNRGIVRAIPTDMGGQTMRVEDVSVTDGDGNPVPYDTQQEFGANDLVLLLGDDSYVHGTTTYVIEYTLVNTLIKNDGDADEAVYAPNLTPTFREQPIDEFSAEVHLDTALWDAVQQQPRIAEKEPGYDGLDANCYLGRKYEDTNCDFSVDRGDATTTIAIDPVDLGDEDVTIDLRLDPTKVQLPNFLEKMSTSQQIAFWLVLALLIASIVFIVLLNRARKPRPLEPIIAQYASEIPPVRASVILSGGRTPKDGPSFNAHVLDAAVHGGIVLEEDDQEKKKPLVRVRYAEAPDGLPSQTQQFRHNVLNLKKEGESALLTNGNEKIAKRWRSFANSATEDIEKAGLAEVSPVVRRWQKLASASLWALILAAAFLIWRFAHVSDDLWLISFGSGGAALVAFFAQLFVIGMNPRQLTQEGRAALTELYGVRDYLKLAEEDRLRALQGAETAERVTGSGPDAATMIHVYERLLPFAVLFGMSKEWSQLLDVKYAEANSSPSYVSGRAAGIMWANQRLHDVNPTYVASSGGGSGSGYSGSSSSFSGGGSAGGGFGGGSVGGR